MGIFDRVSRLVRANVNDALDGAEDPEKMLEQLIRDMEVEIRQARGQVANMIAQEKELAADKAEADRLAAEWQRRAELAVEGGKDELAREALRRKRDAEENARIYGEQLVAQQGAVTRLKAQLRELETKRDQMESRRDTLIARSRRAQAQQRVGETMTKLPDSDAAGEFERFERRIRSSEARAAATTEMAQLDNDLDDEFDALDQDAGVEDELAALKARKSGGSADGQTVSSAQTTGASSGDSVDDELARMIADREGGTAGGAGTTTGGGGTGD
jgi:phage shock protein A